MSYIDQDTLDQCREAIRQGATIVSLAGKLGCNPTHLARLLGTQALQPVPTDGQDQDFDLFAAERLDGVL